MTAGVVVANFARHHDYAFHEIENIQWAVHDLVFVLAGASLELRRSGHLVGRGFVCFASALQRELLVVLWVRI